MAPGAGARRSRERLDDLWQRHVASAMAEYQRCVRALGALERQHAVQPIPEIAAARGEAARAEVHARDHYRQVLRVFTELTIYGKPPSDSDYALLDQRPHNR